MSEPILELEDVTIQYSTAAGPLTAVSDASLSFQPGEYFGLAGESGCGKSTLAQSILGALDRNGRVASGTIRYKGKEIQDYSEKEMNDEIRWKEIAWIPQGSMNSLDPLQRVQEQALEIADVHTDLTEAEAIEKFREMFEIVGLQKSRISDYPHQFSGGMQQRAIIALALFLEPSLVVADEPTTALDVIMQDQIFKYLVKAKSELDLSMMLITHDISVVLESCDKMAIMHSGQISESGTVEDLADRPRHPYSILLQESFPDIQHPKRELSVIDGHPPQTVGEVDYCTFVDRCPWAVDECEEKAPPLEGENGHAVACVRADEVHELYREEQEQTGTTNR